MQTCNFKQFFENVIKLNYQFVCLEICFQNFSQIDLVKIAAIEYCEGSGIAVRTVILFSDSKVCPENFNKLLIF